MTELHFTEENLEWLSALVTRAETETKDKVKLIKLSGLKNKIEKLQTSSIDITITEDDIQQAKESLQRLDELNKEYAESKDIGDLALYDSLKKRMSGELNFLGKLKDDFNDELNYIEEVFKKEIRAKIAKEIEGSGESFTKAEKLVDNDERYKNLRKKIYAFKKLASEVKTKYDFYLKAWNMVFQSVSTATKERFNEDNNNNN